MNKLSFLLFFLVFGPNPKLLAAESPYSYDVKILKKVAEKLIGKSKKYKLYFNFNDEDPGHVIHDFEKNIFKIYIGKKSYDESGPAEGSLLLACHELGHAAAGNKDGVSSEENADYWAANICMPEMLKHFPDIDEKTTTPFDNEFKKACEKYKNIGEQNSCFRTLRGSYLFRYPTYKGFCNTQELFFKSSEESLSKTPYKGKRAPNFSQCSFNNLIAGALKFKQPTCNNLIMIGPSLFNEDCTANSVYESVTKELGIEEEFPTNESSIVNSSRNTQINKADDLVPKKDAAQTVSK
jgi:hypothetical protein